MYQLLLVGLLFLTGCDEPLVLGIEDVNVSENKLFASAQALRAGGDYAEAAVQFENFVGLFPFSDKKSEANIRLMEIYDRQGKYDDLESFSSELMNAGASTPQSVYYFAKANLKLSHSEFFEKISAKMGGHDAVKLEKSKAAYEKLLGMKDIPVSMKKQVNMDYSQVCELIADNHYRIGQFYLKKGKKKAAELRFQKIKTSFPKTQAAKKLSHNQRSLTKRAD
ncbi:outer membrane protein assembly factor BamD [Gammaproteobacteria bacterium]|nr:outer membrane protein assembly factor BamD [Gammaproteobacteria bacterium]